MNTPQYLKRIIAGAVLSSSLAVAGVGLAAGTAQANTRGPYQWCPGQHLPESDVVWDMNVCTPGTGSTTGSRPIAVILYTRELIHRRILAASPASACPGCDPRDG
jgi:hypothetical protein